MTAYCGDEQLKVGLPDQRQQFDGRQGFDRGGFPEDGVVTTDTGSLIRWYEGESPLGATQRTGRMTVRAPQWLVRELGRWGRLNPYRGVMTVRTR